MPNPLAAFGAPDADGIFHCEISNLEQAVEREMRERIATDIHRDPMESISRSHSIPVMDHEVRRFLADIPRNGWIADVGGCWGWHWRGLAEERPDVRVVIVDFVCSNLYYARDILGAAINDTVFLVHGDATQLRFRDEAFDGYWSVQTLQHIPSFETAVREAHRILKRGGRFANYSLNDQPLIRRLYGFLGRTYVREGQVPGAFWLARASAKQRKIVESVFAAPVTERVSEILYSPELHFAAPGRRSSLLGRIDAALSNDRGIFGSIARQRSLHCTKA